MDRNTNIYVAIGRRIRRARENLGMSQEEMARKVGLSSPASISHFEAGGRKISIADLQRIAAILGVPPEYLLEDSKATAGRYFRLRAQQVRPSARGEVASFLAFAQKHGKAEPPLAAGLGGLRPGAAAQRILDELAITDPPIKIRELAAQVGVPVFDWDFPDEISGIFVCDDGMACIGINSAHPRVRQRFSIAHELGHLVFRGDEDLFVDFVAVDVASLVEDPRMQASETKANQFAADLLMPRGWLRQDVSVSGLDVAFLSRRYEVSEQALWFRLVALKLAADETPDGP